MQVFKTAIAGDNSCYKDGFGSLIFASTSWKHVFEERCSNTGLVYVLECVDFCIDK